MNSSKDSSRDAQKPMKPIPSQLPRFRSTTVTPSQRMSNPLSQFSPMQWK